MSIELQIRRAIAKAEAVSADARMEVYSKAKRAVCKLPTETQIKFAQELSNAIYAIEYEYYAGTKQDRTAEQPSNPTNNHLSVTDIGTSKWSVSNRGRTSSLLKGWPGNHGKLAVVLFIAVVLGISLSVGYFRPDKQVAEVSRVQDSVIRNANGSAIEPVFELMYPRDIDNLIVSRKGVKIDNPVTLKSGDLLTITDEIEIMTSKTFQIDRTKTYMGQINFRIIGAQESETSLPSIHAGLYNLAADGNPMTEGTLFSHFIHTGAVDPLRISTNQDRDVTITGIISTEGHGQHDKFADGAVSFRLFTGVVIEEKNWKVELKSMKLSEVR